MQQDDGLSAAYLRANCPVAWNTDGRQDAYARLGIDAVRVAFDILEQALGDGGEIAPEEMPVAIDLDVVITRTDGEPALRVLEEQTGEIRRGDGRTPCEPNPENPAITADYVAAHQVSDADEAEERQSFVLLGYAATQAVIFSLIEEGGADGDEAQRVLTLTVSSTFLHAGCMVVCVGRSCVHKRG